MRKGLDAFDKNSVNDNDKRLVAWVRLQMIAEGVEALRIKVSLAQPGADAASLVDQHTISSLESRFGRWRDAAQPVLNGKGLPLGFMLSFTAWSGLFLLANEHKHDRLTPDAFLLLPRQALRAGRHMQSNAASTTPRDAATSLGSCSGCCLHPSHHVSDTV